MKQTKYNYKGRPIGPKLAQELRMDGLKATPTSRQRKFLYVLENALERKDIQAYEDKHRKPVTREGYKDTIDRLIALCESNGIELRLRRNPDEPAAGQEADPNDPFDM